MYGFDQVSNISTSGLEMVPKSKNHAQQLLDSIERTNPATSGWLVPLPYLAKGCQTPTRTFFTQVKEKEQQYCVGKSILLCKVKDHDNRGV